MARLPSCCQIETYLSRICCLSPQHDGTSSAERACEGAPDLIAEILSRFQPAHTERDQFVKRELYARHGVPEYWILSPDAETVLVLSKPVIRAGVGEYTSEHLYRVGDILTTTAIPGFGDSSGDDLRRPAAKDEAAVSARQLGTVQ